MRSNDDELGCIVLRKAGAISTVAAVVLGVTPQVSMAAPSGPVASRCVLETTQRVAFRVDNAPRDMYGVGLRMRFYDAHKTWMAEEMFDGGPLSAPILPIAGLLDPRGVAAVECAIDGYVPLNSFHFIDAGTSNSGQKACPQYADLFVDGGADGMVDASVVGRNWIMMRFQATVNHFLPNQETALAGDVLQASLDGGLPQKVVVSGDDPQYVSFLFTDVRPGFHEIRDGPWSMGDTAAMTNGYHSYCVRLAP